MKGDRQGSYLAFDPGHRVVQQRVQAQSVQGVCQDRVDNALEKLIQLSFGNISPEVGGFRGVGTVWVCYYRPKVADQTGGNGSPLLLWSDLYGVESFSCHVRGVDNEGLLLDQDPQPIGQRDVFGVEHHGRAEQSDDLYRSRRGQLVVGQQVVSYQPYQEFPATEGVGIGANVESPRVLLVSG